MKKIIFCIFLIHVFICKVNSQNDFEAINTGSANFLTITSNARKAGMGGVGTALTGENDAIFSNGATVFANERKAGFTYTFSPWMRDYESGHSLHNIGGFYKIDNRNSILAGFRYYNYPKIGLIENSEEKGKDIRPKEMAVELGYAHEIIPDLSLSATFRYIHSNMGSIGEAKNADAVAFDLGAFYKRNMNFLKDASWAIGFQVSNIGTQMKYMNSKEDLPTQMKLGGSIDFPFSQTHRFIVATDMGYRSLPSDASSFNVSAGCEYILIEHFSLRGGYHYGDKDKGDFSYATAGLGINYYDIRLDFSWLFAESKSPIKNTFQLSLGYSF